MSAPPAPTSIAPIIAQWMDFDDDDTEGQEFAQAVASAIWDQLLAEGTIRYEGRDRLIRNYPARTWQPVLVLPLAGLDTDTPT